MYQGFEDKFNNSQITTRDTRDPVSCKNQSGEEIPPRSAIQFDGTFTGYARDVIKPSGNSLNSSVVAITGEQTIAIGAVFDLDITFESLAAVSGTPIIGGAIGTVTDEWSLSALQAGFIARGASGGYAYAVPFSGGEGVIEGKAMAMSDGGTDNLNSGYNALSTYSIPIESQFSVSIGDIIALNASAGVASFTGRRVSTTGEISARLEYTLMSGTETIDNQWVSLYSGPIETSNYVGATADAFMFRSRENGTVDSIQVDAYSDVTGSKLSWAISEAIAYPFSPS